VVSPRTEGAVAARIAAADRIVVKRNIVRKF